MAISTSWSSAVRKVISLSTENPPGLSFASADTRRLDLASGRVATIDDRPGFELVPWKPPVECLRDRDVRGDPASGRGEAAAVRRQRGLSL
jgi:hypothetical protein